MTKTTGQEIARQIEEKAYSAHHFANGEWAGLADMLLARGLTALETMAVMCSKHTRWSRDSAGRDEGTVADFETYMGHNTRWFSKPELRKLVRESREFLAA